MNAIKMLMVASVMMSATASATAADVVLAWQTPGYVMEEIVVTAKRPARPAPESTEAAQHAEVPEECL